MCIKTKARAEKFQKGLPIVFFFFEVILYITTL